MPQKCGGGAILATGKPTLVECSLPVTPRNPDGSALKGQWKPCWSIVAILNSLPVCRIFFSSTDNMSALDSNMPENRDMKDLECPDTTTDAVFGEITEEGPNYRSVSDLSLRKLALLRIYLMVL